MTRFATTIRNLQIWAVVATVAWGGSTILWGCERYMDPRLDFADGGATGPYEVSIVGTSNNELPVYRIVGAVEAVEPGQLVGFSSTFCVEKDTYVLGRSDMYRLRDGALVAHGRERLWTPQDHRCGTSIGAIELPADAEAGDYEIRRTAWGNPLGWFPQRLVISGVKFHVEKGTKPAR